MAEMEGVVDNKRRQRKQNFGSGIFWIGKQILGAVLWVLGGMGKKAGRRVKEKIWGAPLKKYCVRNIMIPRVFFNLVSGSRHREALGFAPL